MNEILLQSVRCCNCGSSLQINEGERFVHCSYCHNQLEVCGDPSSHFTQRMDELMNSHQNSARFLEILTLEKELDRLGVNWLATEKGFKTRLEDGRLIFKWYNWIDGLLITFGVAVLILIPIIGLHQIDWANPLAWAWPIVGVGLIVAGVVQNQRFRRIKADYLQLQNDYAQQQSNLLAKIEQLKAAEVATPIDRAA